MKVLVAGAGLACCLTLVYALALQPAWEPSANDQLSYLALARGLVERSEYTRAPIGDAFAPEPLRPPGYPLFLAPLCMPSCDHWRIAIVQALFYSALVLLVYAVAMRVLTRRRAAVAALLVGVYLPMAYSAALALSDFLAVVLLTASLAAFLRARAASSAMWGGAAGALLGWLALTRAVYVLFPAVLLVVVLAVEGRRVFQKRALRPLVTMCIAFVFVLTPLLVYSDLHFGRPFASSSGSAIWLGAVQGLTENTIDDYERSELAAVREAIAEFDAVTDRVAQADGWVRLNEQLGGHGMNVIAHDPVGYVARAPLRAIVLWAGDLPVPLDSVATLPSVVRIAISAAQLAVFVFALIGATVLARRRTDAALLPLAVIVYVSAVSIPLGTEARYALAAKPLVLLAAVAAFSALSHRRGADHV